MPVDFDRIRELLDTLAQTDVTELTLKCEDFDLTVRRGDTAAVPPARSPVPESEAPVALPSPVPAAPTAESTPPALPKDEKWEEIVSPMVGTFYRAPAPNDPPYVNVGDRIRPAQVVCIIEAMKLMNEIEAEVGGEVTEVLVQNGEPVEYGQVLMRVRPEGDRTN